MNKLKIILQSEASKYIHLAIVLSLYIGSERSIIFLLLLFIEIVFLFRNAKSFLLIVLIFLLLFQFRNFFTTNHELDSSKTSLTGKITRVYSNGFVLFTEKESVYVYSLEFSQLLPGDIITIQGSFFESEIHQVKHAFDYKTYLSTLGIYNQFYASSIMVTSHSFSILEISQRILYWIQNTFDKETIPYLIMFILGNDDYMDETKISMFRTLGISHLFAISGMHVGFFIFLLEKILNRFYMPKKTKSGIIVCFLCLYNIITGFLVSILRASIQVTLIFISKEQKWFFSKTDLLSFSFVFFLFVERNIIYQVGFQLSYLITFAIILGQELFKQKSPLTKMIEINLFATLFSLPIILEMNGYYGLLSIIASVFFLEFVSLLFLPIAIMTMIFPMLSGAFLQCIYLFEWLLVAFENANILISFNFPSLIHKTIYYIGIILLIINYMKKKRIINPLLIITYSFLLSFLVPMNPLVTKVIFLDVGQGDATYIHSGSCNILIDTGPRDDYDTVINFLKGENISSLDALIITHFHSDHFGEARDILDAVSVSHLYANKESSDFPEISVLEKGNEVKCGNLQFFVLHSDTLSVNENNNSLVLFSHIGTDNYLFLGDIESDEEVSIIPFITEDIDIFKVAHHGSETSSTKAFIENVKPKIAIISVGKNTYGHPSNDIINRFQQSNIVAFRTDQVGTIEITYIFNDKMRYLTHFMFGIGVEKRQLLSCFLY